MSKTTKREKWLIAIISALSLGLLGGGVLFIWLILSI